MGSGGSSATGDAVAATRAAAEKEATDTATA
jgi:trimeric autotransporter adhesin